MSATRFQCFPSRNGEGGEVDKSHTHHTTCVASVVRQMPYDVDRFRKVAYNRVASTS